MHVHREKGPRSIISVRNLYYLLFEKCIFRQCGLKSSNVDSELNFEPDFCKFLCKSSSKALLFLQCTGCTAELNATEPGIFLVILSQIRSHNGLSLSVGNISYYKTSDIFEF